MWAKHKQNGFTIVELLIVIVVIGILAAITIVAYNGIQKKAQLASLQTEAHSNINKLELYRVENATYPSVITDCPTPSTANICLTSGSGNSYVYRSNVAGGSGYMINLATSYELTIMGSSQFIYTSSAVKTGSSEFMQYIDLAPMIDRYGLTKYQLSFDIKSASTANASSVNVYFQNGNGARYGGLSVGVGVTTSYSHHVIDFTPSMNDSSMTASILAFYGTYSTGNIPTVKDVQIQFAP